MSYSPNGDLDLSCQAYLQSLWSTQLNRADIAMDDDFFESGGSSMQVIEMLMTVADRFGKEIDFAEFFRQPSIRRLSELLAY